MPPKTYKIVRDKIFSLIKEKSTGDFDFVSIHNSQIADYGSWSKYVSLERGEYRPIKEIYKIIKSDLDLSEDK